MSILDRWLPKNELIENLNTIPDHAKRFRGNGNETSRISRKLATGLILAAIGVGAYHALSDPGLLSHTSSLSTNQDPLADIMPLYQSGRMQIGLVDPRYIDVVVDMQNLGDLNFHQVLSRYQANGQITFSFLGADTSGMNHKCSISMPASSAQGVFERIRTTGVAPMKSGFNPRALEQFCANALRSQKHSMRVDGGRDFAEWLANERPSVPMNIVHDIDPFRIAAAARASARS